MKHEVIQVSYYCSRSTGTVFQCRCFSKTVSLALAAVFTHAPLWFLFFFFFLQSFVFAEGTDKLMRNCKGSLEPVQRFNCPTALPNTVCWVYFILFFLVKFQHKGCLSYWEKNTTWMVDKRVCWCCGVLPQHLLITVRLPVVQ